MQFTAQTFEHQEILLTKCRIIAFHEPLRDEHAILKASARAAALSSYVCHNMCSYCSPQ
ncbi:hypothetical protein BIFGAL_03432 [Bifidobacterium gallicum DSM 20093 = LMG 11596]|uniref:Uncharacterized protein n=1 Tax=Bifidobacterium gallicum DSM 20093 = LMG 11596 TaxID=561180 RepID=D1NUB1_9BIFI|nr:hypothetical protein BIFGAL_03432 [Bifidobacterium gallicum DSM 20093 = LMG 11596]